MFARRITTKDAPDGSADSETGPAVQDAYFSA